MSSQQANFSQHEELESLGAAYALLSGVPQRLSGELADVYEALAAGQAVLVELPWFEQRGQERIGSNQILLQDCDGERVYFANPRRGDQGPGELVAANGHGPERQIERDGIESMERGLFERLFEQGGGLALLDAEAIDNQAAPEGEPLG